MAEQYHFSLTAAQVGAADDAARTIATFGGGSGVVLVPVALHLHKPAGDAYTVTAGTRLEIKDSNNVVLFSTEAAPLLGAAAYSIVLLPHARKLLANATSATLFFTGSVAAGSSSPRLIGFVEFERRPLALPDLSLRTV